MLSSLQYLSVIPKSQLSSFSPNKHKHFLPFLLAFTLWSQNFWVKSSFGHVPEGRPEGSALCFNGTKLKIMVFATYPLASVFKCIIQLISISSHFFFARLLVSVGQWTVAVPDEWGQSGSSERLALQAVFKIETGLLCTQT